jgi:hypothetical protein
VTACRLDPAALSPLDGPDCDTDSGGGAEDEQKGGGEGDETEERASPHEGS